MQPSGYLEFLQEHTRCPSRNAPGPEATPLQSVFLAWPSLPLRPALRAAAGGGTTVMTVMMAEAVMCTSVSHGDGGDAARSGWPLGDGTVDGVVDGALVVQPMVPSPLSPHGHHRWRGHKRG